MKLLKLIPIIAVTCSFACFPYAWVTPPAKFELAGGLAVSEAGDFNAGFQGTAGVYPLQVFPDYYERNFDAGVGYTLLYISPDQDQILGQYLHGPYVDVVYFLPIDSATPIRGYISAKGKVLLNSPEFGFGGTGQLGMEIFEFSDNDFYRCTGRGCSQGTAYGESALGIFVEGSQFFYGNNQMTFFGLGLSFRSPATAGMGWAFF